MFFMTVSLVFHDGMPFSRRPSSSVFLKSAFEIVSSSQGSIAMTVAERSLLLALEEAHAPFEINQGGFELSGPRYYARFRDVCLDFLRTAGVNQFKFDGTGNVNTAVPGSAFGSDFEAMIHLIGELRQAKPSPQSRPKSLVPRRPRVRVGGQ